MFTRIAVLGAGIMGYGIALDFARCVADVRLLDVDDAAVQHGLTMIDLSLRVMCEEGALTDEEARRVRGNIRPFTDLAAAVAGADMVLEALPERLDLKHSVLREADRHATEHAVFITNTSSLRPSEIFAVLPPARRTRCALAHYFQPAEVIPLVEIMGIAETDEAVLTAMRELYLSNNKVPVRVRKELPGLSVNRIQMAVWREVLWQLQNGVMDKEDLDMVLPYGPALRWATAGPLTVMDLGGLDTACPVADNIFKDLDNAASAPPVLRELRDAGHYGLKTGRGFFDYPEAERTTVKDAYVRRLTRQLALSLRTMKERKG